MTRLLYHLLLTWTLMDWRFSGIVIAALGAINGCMLSIASAAEESSGFIPEIIGERGLQGDPV